MHATPEATSLINDGISAYKAGNIVQAFALLTQALRLDPNSEAGWLWLSGVVNTAAEKRYCLEYVLALNPQNQAAWRGLNMLPPGEPPRSPLPEQSPAAAPAASPPPEASVAPVARPAPEARATAELPRCSYPGCTEWVARAGHTLCHAHWKSSRSGAVPESRMLTANMLGERLSIPGQLINQILLDLGWIVRQRNGYIPSSTGKLLGATRQRHQQGNFFVEWPEAILEHKALQTAVLRASGKSAAAPTGESSFRDRYPATYRTNDGHMVRSRAEVMIDNWLYEARIVHAYERRLPVDEEAYCDFYLPTGRVYLEYWGLEGEAKYDARKQDKLAIYQKHSLNLVELTDQEIQRLDDHLPRLLRKYGIEVS